MTRQFVCSFKDPTVNVMHKGMLLGVVIMVLDEGCDMLGSVGQSY